MIAFNFETPAEMALKVAMRAREKRLSLEWTQKTLAQRSGVSLAVVKQFEQTGKIAFVSLLKLALCLGALEGFNGLFEPGSSQGFLTLEDVVKLPRERQRGRK